MAKNLPGHDAVGTTLPLNLTLNLVDELLDQVTESIQLEMYSKHMDAP